MEDLHAAGNKHKKAFFIQNNVFYKRLGLMNRAEQVIYNI